jgi:hypothetical protein
MTFSMRKPNFGKPRSAVRAFSLSGHLPRLKAPLSAARVLISRPRPAVGRPGQPAAPAPGGRVVDGCKRCGHGRAEHPIRYVCDKYPHPDPLQICGCEVEHVDDVCARCGHKARSHKPRHRCKAADCRCWGFDGEGEAAGGRPC